MMFEVFVIDDVYLQKDASIDSNEMKNGEAVRRLAGALGGITIMQKGSVDLISNGNEGIR